LLKYISANADYNSIKAKPGSCCPRATHALTHIVLTQDSVSMLQITVDFMSN